MIAVLMNKSRTIEYRFTPPGGATRTFEVELELPTLKLRTHTQATPADWARLEYEQCPNCPVGMAGHEYCPVALALIPVVGFFSEYASYEQVDVCVHTEPRDFHKTCPLQMGASSLIGLIMATSGCPVLDRLRPMAYTHLPFSDAKETTFRAISTYLMAQFIRRRQKRECDWDLSHLMDTYDEIRVVNRAFANRIRSMSGKDAGVNAMLLLDTFAGIASFALHKRWWEDIEPLFAPEAECYSESERSGRSISGKCVW